jgi:hypothetical protein
MATAPASFRREAIINVDGTISATFGEHKQGMDISYNGQWGYHPLVVSLQTKAEHLCHFTYRPTKCKKTYRMIVLRKQLKVIKGEMYLFNNDWHRSSADMIQFYRNRADHENDIDQLKNGVKALSQAIGISQNHEHLYGYRLILRVQ